MEIEGVPLIIILVTQWINLYLFRTNRTLPIAISFWHTRIP